MQLFYTNNIHNQICHLDAEESKHAVRVMRLRTNEPIFITDGMGNLHHCRLLTADERGCTAQIEHTDADKSKHAKMHLAVASTKNPARTEWLVEKAVELGVASITLLHCEHSERMFIKAARLEKIAISAMKQSLHTWLPTITGPVNMTDWLRQGEGFAPTTINLIAHCDVNSPRTNLIDALKPNCDVTMLIGPEGDFSPTEVSAAIDHKFTPVSFGNSRLRTETAAVFAAAAFLFTNPNA